MKLGTLKFSCSHLSFLLSSTRENRPLTSREVADFLSLLSKEDLNDTQISKLKHYVLKQTNYNPNVLSNSAKSDLIKLYAWENYGKGKVSDLSENFAIQKGTIVEKDSIRLISELDGIQYIKNEKFYKNRYIKGFPDIVTKGKNKKVIDVKSSQDITTFLTKVQDGLTYEYKLQMQGYLELVGAEYGEVCFCLVNTPPEIIEKEVKVLKSKFYLYGKSEQELFIALEQLYKNMIFDDIPIERRIIRFRVEKDTEKMQLVYHRVKVARAWLKQFHKKHING
jgi:hypothetical protein